MSGDSFDDRAATWDDDPEKRTRATAVADLIRQVTGPDPDARVLEYGAGTGLLSEALVGHVGPITLADPSRGMRQVLADKVSAGIFPGATRIWDVDLSTAPPPAEEFDLVVSLMALHHIPDVPAVLRACVALLAPGGRVCLSDLVAEDGSFHDSPDADVHHGFGTDALAEQLRQAGLVSVDVRHAYDVIKDGRTYPLFLATAVRPG